MKLIKHKPRKDVKRRFVYLNLIIGCVFIGILLIAAIFADVIAPYEYDYSNVSERMLEPGGDHLLGTDVYGRDIFSRILFGSRIALRVALVCVCIEMFLGIVFGLLCGYFGGWVDKILGFIMDITWTIPSLIAAFAIVCIIGKSLMNAMIAISLVGWASYARVIRAKTMSLKNAAFIETGVAFGESVPALLTRYILPNIVPALVVIASQSIPGVIMATTSLSFLGLGAQSPSPDWGLMISDGLTRITAAPWMVLYPGLALIFTTFGFTMLGEGVRDLLDPRMKAV